MSNHVVKRLTELLKFVQDNEECSREDFIKKLSNLVECENFNHDMVTKNRQYEELIVSATDKFNSEKTAELIYWLFTGKNLTNKIKYGKRFKHYSEVINILSVMYFYQNLQASEYHKSLIDMALALHDVNNVLSKEPYVSSLDEYKNYFNTLDR